MKLSQTEHKIKKDLAQREVAPSQNIWENIEQELDKNAKPKKQKTWLKYASIAAVLCVGFLVYQGLQTRTTNSSQLVLESKSVIEKELQLKLNTAKISYVASPQTIRVEDVSMGKSKALKNKIQTQNTQPKKVKPSIDIEVDNLLSQAQNTLVKAEKEKQLLNEVNSLLADAMQQTQDEEQKKILQNLQATTLLAEVEAEIELQKPKNLKDKIWEALVSNLNDIKQAVVLN